MGQLLKYPDVTDRPVREMEPKAMRLAESGANILVFTGVRYERLAKMPDMKRILPSRRKGLLEEKAR